jgi:soluble lytic murein transglycosylase-like protein
VVTHLVLGQGGRPLQPWSEIARRGQPALRVPRACIYLTLCVGVACSAPVPERVNTTVYIPAVVNRVLSWHAPGYAEELFGARLLYDGPLTNSPTLAVTRAVLHTNPRISPIDALRLAGATVRAAQRSGLPPEFLAATLLQESAFDPQAISAAGAIGIAQFMPSTADGIGIDPFDPFDAIDSAAQLLSGYVRAYGQQYANPYATALAAYNAGPGAVSQYHGVPPYPETRDYINDIVDRWAKIAGYERRNSGP